MQRIVSYQNQQCAYNPKLGPNFFASKRAHFLFVWGKTWRCGEKRKTAARWSAMNAPHPADPHRARATPPLHSWVGWWCGGEDDIGDDVDVVVDDDDDVVDDVVVDVVVDVVDDGDDDDDIGDDGGDIDGMW